MEGGLSILHNDQTLTRITVVPCKVRGMLKWKWLRVRCDLDRETVTFSVHPLTDRTSKAQCVVSGITGLRNYLPYAICDATVGEAVTFDFEADPSTDDTDPVPLMSAIAPQSPNAWSLELPD
jgi:hypothetical protein